MASWRWKRRNYPVRRVKGDKYFRLMKGSSYIMISYFAKPLLLFAANSARHLASCVVLVIVLSLMACAGPSTPPPDFPASEPHTRGAVKLLSEVYLTHAEGLQLEPWDPLAVRVVTEFGAVFVAQGGAVTPREWMFPNESAVATFQSKLAISASVSSPPIELQFVALAAFQAAVHEAAGRGLTISPNGPGSARRSYHETLKLWRSRLDPGLAHWVKAGKLTRTDADRLLALSPRQQVTAALELEAHGAWLSTGFDKSILQSVAAPGTSQHLSLLAIDVSEHANSAVREVLARHGWYQTVYSDLPHFTFVGVSEDKLPSLGLVRRLNSGRVFWVVNAPRLRGEVEPDVMEQCAF